MIAIAITVFRPEAGRLAMLLTMLDSTLALFVHVDGPVGDAITESDRQILYDRPGCVVIEAPSNRGIGHGLNQLKAAAKAASFEYLLFFDQDSEPEFDHPARLKAALDALGEQGEHPAVVGPRPIVPYGEAGKAPTYFLRGKGSWRMTDFVIISGALFNLKAFDDVGPFRSDFVMDSIDVEWCLRASALGWSVWCDTTLAMPHRVGRGTTGWGPVRFPAQSLDRMRGYVHNQAILMRLAHIPWQRKCRIALYLPLQILLFATMHPQPEPNTRSRSQVLHSLVSSFRNGWGAG
jgi:rhamnosyltransferase